MTEDEKSPEELRRLRKNERSRKWRLENPQKSRDAQRAWRQQNRDKANAYKREWHARNRDKKNATNRAWREANAETQAEYFRKYREDNRELLRTRQREYYLANRERYQEQMRAKRYGLAPGEFDAMLAAQNGRCAICRTRTPGGKGWAVDHCHDEGHVRGILCPQCNTGIGLLRHDSEILRAALAYLGRTSE
jgi:hypothetical protein